MKRYIFGRLLQLFFLLIATATAAFFLVHLIPGGPEAAILGEGASGEDVLRLHRRLNLDKPLLEQYIVFVRDLARLDFGRSVFDQRPVLVHILDYLPNTLSLVLAAMLPALLIAFPLGVVAALRENGPMGTVVTLFTSFGAAIPTFFLGPLLIILFSVQLGWLPVSGSGGIRHLVLPALTLALSMAALLTRIVRTAVGTELKKSYVLAARARGLGHWRLFTLHLFRNSLIPIVTTLGLQMGALLTGAIITETVFSRPGLGTLLITAVRQRDYPMVQGTVIFVTGVYLLLNFLVDLSYPLIDPRVRYDRYDGRRG